MKQYLFKMMFLFLLGCSSSKNIVEQKCPKIYKNNFSEVIDAKYETINGNDTLVFNEVRFECVFSALYTHKVMFDNYGKWDKEIYPSNRKHPILVWKNVELFYDGKKYNIYTNGLEDRKHIYASIMVFDENNVDLLKDNSLEKDNLTHFFAKLLKNQDTENKSFYEIYWKKVDPERWEFIKKN